MRTGFAVGAHFSTTKVLDELRSQVDTYGCGTAYCFGVRPKRTLAKVGDYLHSRPREFELTEQVGTGWSYMWSERDSGGPAWLHVYREAPGMFDRLPPPPRRSR